MTDKELMNKIIELAPYSTIPDDASCEDLFIFIKDLLIKKQFEELTNLGKLYNGSKRVWCDYYEDRYKYLNGNIK